MNSFLGGQVPAKTGSETYFCPARLEVPKWNIFAKSRCNYTMSGVKNSFTGKKKILTGTGIKIGNEVI